MTADSSNSKPGLRQLKPSELLFNDGDRADSLYIIQTGQIRLFKPKGKGFIEVGTLRAGEVIGEMAYFDETGGKRSCSAMAQGSTSVIEISFSAFGKTMSALNPWFKTIINTLVNRLRSTTNRVKELESNSASLNYNKSQGEEYEFLKTSDVMKILGVLYLVFKSHGESHAKGTAIHRKILSLYTQDVFNTVESRLTEIFIILEDLALMNIIKDKEGSPKILILKNLDALRSFLLFMSDEKRKKDDKKIVISEKCQIFIEAIWKKIALSDIDDLDETNIEVDITELLEDWKQANMNITTDDLQQAYHYGLATEAVLDRNNNIMISTNYLKLNRLLPSIQFINRINQSNIEKRQQRSF